MQDALVIKSLHKTYSNGVEALKNLNLSVGQGDFFALLGANGAGKSTTIGIVNSIVKKTSGKIFIQGIDTDENFLKAKSQLGVVAQELNLNQFEKVVDVVRRQAGYYGLSPRTARTNTERYLKKLQLWDKRDVTVRELSGGMKRRMMVAKAMVHEANLLILDEPTAGVDIETRRETWDFLKEINSDGTTIILTTHYLEEAEALCKNIAIINKGELVIDTSMRDLLGQLEMETYVFDLADEIGTDADLRDLTWRIKSPCEIEVDLPRGDTVNHIFSELSRNEIGVLSMRTKTNRLEMAFMHTLHQEVS